MHTYGTEADLHKDGTVQRQIGYADEMLPEIAQKDDVPNLLIVSVRRLVDAPERGSRSAIAPNKRWQVLSFAERSLWSGTKETATTGWSSLYGLVRRMLDSPWSALAWLGTTGSTPTNKAQKTKRTTGLQKMRPEVPSGGYG